MSKMRDDGSITLTAIGNPIVDVTVLVQDSQFFEQHGIPFDGQWPVTDEFLATLKEDFERRNYKTMIFPGGCAQNTSRVFQWLMVSKFQTCMIGAIGGDNEGILLKDTLEQDGVKPCYLVANDWQTYSVLVFVYQNSRFIAYPQDNRAAGNYSMSRFLCHTDALRSIENSSIVFIEGFFAEHSPQVAQKVLDMCVDTGIVTSFNLCGVDVVEQYFETSVDPFLKKCNVVIGNLEEFNCLCTKLDIPSGNIEQAVADVHRVMMLHIPTATYRVKSLERHKKILIVTNGDKAMLCVTGDSDGGLIKYLPPVLDRGKIKDTTGAGDSFIAGFLYGLSKEQPISRCLEIACSVAAKLIQQYGLTLPETKIDFLEDG